jgi:hypothetical protein
MLIDTSLNSESKKGIIDSITAFLSKSYKNYEIKKYTSRNNNLKHDFNADYTIKLRWDGVISSQNCIDIKVTDFDTIASQNLYHIHGTLKKIPQDNWTLINQVSNENNAIKNSWDNFVISDSQLDEFRTLVLQNLWQLDTYYSPYSGIISIKFYIDIFNNVITYKINKKLNVSFEYAHHVNIYSIFEILHNELQNLPPPTSHGLMSIFINYTGIDHEKTEKTFCYN